MTLAFAWLGLIFPLLGVLVPPVLGRVSPTLRDYTAVSFAFLTAVSAAMLLPSLLAADSLPLESTHVWLESPVHISVGVLLDPLSIVVANVVAVISFLIMVYSVGYMSGDPGLTRFWILMNGFIGSMLLLVLANNLIFTFIGWKLVGLCSYGLIGYYYRDERRHWIGGPSPYPFAPPSACALKALIVTSVGDMLMLGGLLMVYFYAGSLNILELYRTVPQWVPHLATSPGIMILVTVLLIAGPVGKSAQFPLHEWLPEAMSGPGPVSALIHAATMVKAGVFFVARLVPIFYYGYWVAGVDAAMYFFVVVAWVGAITAVMAASQGLVAKELKKILAYSTVSQIGFMMLALGVTGFTRDLLVDGYTAGIFHLMSHAMFKAGLFLCAGTVIHAAHSIYVHDMGALRRHLPYTWIFMTVAALSLMGVPPLPGFWSKEAVLGASLGSGQYLLSGLAIITVVLTAFYTVRLLGMVFHGPPSAHLRELAGHHAHIGEGYRAQTFACGALAVGIVAFGLIGSKVEHALHRLFEVSLVQTIPGIADHTGHATPGSEGMALPLLVPALSVVALLAGAVPAYFFYVSGRWDAGLVLRRFPLSRAVHVFLWERWYINKTYDAIFVRGAWRGAAFVAERVETILDAAAHRALPEGVLRFSTAVVRRAEDILDAGLNRTTPWAIVRGGQSLLALMRAEAPGLSISITYVVGVAVILILIALLRMLA